MSKNSAGYQTDPFVAQLDDQVIPYAERPDIDFFVQEKALNYNTEHPIWNTKNQCPGILSYSKET